LPKSTPTKAARIFKDMYPNYQEPKKLLSLSFRINTHGARRHNSGDSVFIYHLRNGIFSNTTY
jgi:hypothetical protein